MWKQLGLEEPWVGRQGPRVLALVLVLSGCVSHWGSFHLSAPISS